MNRDYFISEIYKNHTINDTQFAGELSINAHIPYDSTVNRSVFENKVSLNDLNITYGLKFSNCSFSCKEGMCLDISRIQGSQIVFNECVFNGEISISYSSIQKIYFSGCIFEKGIIIVGAPGNEFKIEKSENRNSHLKGNITFRNPGSGGIIIKDTKSEKDIFFDSIGLINSVTIGNGEYNAIIFNEFALLQKLIIRGISESRNGLIIKKFKAPNLSLQDRILIQNVEIEEMDLSPFNQNQGRFKIQNVKFTNKLIVRDSDLGEILFNEIDFSSAKICLDNSYLGKCIFSNIKWPREKKIYSYKEIEQTPIQDKLKNTLILKEVYRQLKDVMKSQSNNIDALDFYRNEMEEYWHEIKKDTQVSRWDKFIVWVSRASSDFGLSLARPLMGLILINSILFFALSLFHYTGININLFHPIWKNTEAGFGEFIMLINPAHKFMENERGIIVFLDFLIRLSSGFFIYHIIRATRKHAKL